MLRRAITPLLGLLLALVVCLALPAGALANDYTQVAAAYLKSASGTLSPCEFSSAELATALKQAQSYDVQYGGDVTTAIQSALAARANGACRAGSSTHTTPAGSLGAGATLKGGGGALPGSADAASSGGLPLVLIVAFALAGGGLLGLAAWVAVNALGFDPRFGRAARHSLREAEYRMGASWDDWTDRLRR